MYIRFLRVSASPREPSGISHWQTFSGDVYTISLRSLRALCETMKISAARDPGQIALADIYRRCIYDFSASPRLRVSHRVFRISRHLSAVYIRVLRALRVSELAPHYEETSDAYG